MKVQKVTFTIAELNLGTPVVKDIFFEYEVRSGSNQVRMDKLKPNDFFMINNSGRDIEYLFLADDHEEYEYLNPTAHLNSAMYTFIPCKNNQAVDKPDFPRQNKIVITGIAGVATADLDLYFMNYYK